MTADVKVSELDVRVTQQDGYRFEVVVGDGKHGPLSMDEPPPIGADTAPSASAYLAAALGNCLAASLVFCLAKHGSVIAHGVEADVKLELVRTPERRLRIGHVAITLRAPPEVGADALAACSAVFEDFCTVTASVRRGIDVTVSVERSGQH